MACHPCLLWFPCLPRESASGVGDPSGSLPGPGARALPFKGNFPPHLLGIQLSLCMPGPSAHPSPPVPTSPPPASGRREVSGMKWGGLVEGWLILLWASPLSLSKNPTQLSHYQGPGLCCVGGGELRQQAPTPSTPAVGPGVRAFMGSPRGWWLCAHKGASYPASWALHRMESVGTVFSSARSLGAPSVSVSAAQGMGRRD